MVINEIPAIPLPTNNGSVCTGTEFTLIAGAGYGADAQYAWYDVNPATFGATVISTQQNPIINDIIVAGTYDYWLIVTEADCASPAGMTTVTIDDAPTVVVNNDGTECIAPTTDLMLSSTPAGGTAPYTFAWTGPNGFASIDQNPVLPNANDLMSGTYILVITDANGCTATDQTVIDVTEGPDQPVVSNDGPHCEGKQLNISTSAYAGNVVDYEWTGPLGTTSGGQYPNAPSITIDPVDETGSIVMLGAFGY